MHGTFIKIGEFKREPFYVYALLRPNGLPFYIGKGKRDRIFAHEKEVKDKTNKTHKHNLIRKILREEGELKYHIFHFTFDEKEAFEFETKLIAYYGRADTGVGILVNHADGGQGASGAIRTEEQNKETSRKITEHYEKNPEAKDQIREKILEQAVRKKVIYTRCFELIEEHDLEIETPLKIRSIETWEAYEQELLEIIKCPERSRNQLFKIIGDTKIKNDGKDAAAKAERKVIYTRCFVLIKKYDLQVGVLSKRRSLKIWQKFEEELLKLIKDPEHSRDQINKLIESKTDKHQGKKIAQSRSGRKEIQEHCLSLISEHNLQFELPPRTKGIKFWKSIEKELLKIINNSEHPREKINSLINVEIGYRSSEFRKKKRESQAVWQQERKTLHIRCANLIETYDLKIELLDRRKSVQIWRDFEQELLKLLGKTVYPEEEVRTFLEKNKKILSKEELEKHELRRKSSSIWQQERKIAYTRCISLIQKHNLNLMPPSKSASPKIWQDFEEQIKKLI